VNEKAAIPDGELAGLKAFALRVEVHAGARYPERPTRVIIDGAGFEVASVESEWREEERIGFRVTLDDGRKLLLYYVADEDLWSGVVVA
jgi:hypothetical protein